jgi:hypothetical protein
MLVPMKQMIPVGTLLLCVFALSAAEPEERKAESPYARAVTKKADRSDTDKAVKVYTNDDLKSLETSELDADAKAPLTNEDIPKAQLPRRAVPTEAARRKTQPSPQQRIARAQDLERVRSSKQAELLLAEQNVEALERRLLQVRNPLLARPVVPEEERAAWEKLDGAGRAALTQQKLEEARAKVKRLRDELDD